MSCLGFDIWYAYFLLWLIYLLDDTKWVFCRQSLFLFRLLLHYRYLVVSRRASVVHLRDLLVTESLLEPWYRSIRQSHRSRTTYGQMHSEVYGGLHGEIGSLRQ
jgi:hypothetical protein